MASSCIQLRRQGSVAGTASSITTLCTTNSDLVPSATGTAIVGRVVTRDRADLTVYQVNLSTTTNSRQTDQMNGSPTIPASPPHRESPVPTQALPNGKPASPLVATSNAMHNGGTSAPQTVTSKDPKAAAQAASDMRNIVRRKLTGYVGFANLPNQWHRKSVRKGFNFNVMVVGKLLDFTWGLKDWIN